MRTFIFLFCATLFAISPNNVVSQNSRIKIEHDKTLAVDEVFDLIMDQTDYKFFYEEGIFKGFPKVHVKKGTIRTNKLLSLSLSKGDLDVTVTGNNAIVIKEVSLKAKPKVLQKITISGTVTDVNSQPLPGANIIEKGTSNGSQTDFDGNFTIDVNDKKAILTISYLGYITKEILVNNQTQIKIIMEEDAASLDEVIVVGYGSQKKGSITGSIATVKSEDLIKTPTSNATASLAGRLPGLVVTQSTGQPGGDAANLSVRGFGNALVIVDGVPRDFQQLDPNDIESISILKDASAAVYGARAGNGVILVTTKRGKTGETRINYSGSVTFQQPTFVPAISNAGSFSEYFRQAEFNEDPDRTEYTYSEEDIARYKAGTEEGYKGTNWRDVVLKDWSSMQQHNINVSGGTEKTNYYGSVGSLQQNSLLRSGDGKFNRYNVGLTVDSKISKRISVGLNLKYREQETENPSSGGTDEPSAYAKIFRFLLSSNPAIQRNPDPNNFLTAAHPLGQSSVAFADKSISGFSNSKRKQFDVVGNFKYDIPIKGLDITGKFAFQRINTLTRATNIPFTTYNYDFAGQEYTPSFTFATDNVSSTNNDFSSITTQVALNYKRTFGDVHNISTSVIFENIYTDRYQFTAGRTQLLDPNTPFLFGALGVQTNNDLVLTNNGDVVPLQQGRQGIINRINYNYKEKYLIEYLFRADANIQFPENTRWGYFPGASLGWVASKENFLENSKTIDFLKLRASYAQLGFDSNSVFDYLSGFNLNSGFDNNYIYGDTSLLTTLRTIGLPNSLITWETMDTYNFGLDARLWNSKLGIEFDVFYRKRSGLLETRLEALPDTFGANLPEENLEVRDNRGFELVLTHRNNIGDLNINVAGNITYTREKFVKEIEREFDSTNPDDARVNQRTGNWVNRRFGYKTDGFYDTLDEINNDGIDYDPIINAGEPSLGDVKYIDTNGDGLIDINDQVLIGRGQTPEIFFGLNVDLEYKGFDFSMLWQGATNFDVALTGRELAANVSIGQIPYQYVVDNSWNSSNPSAAKLPAPSLSGLTEHNDQTLDIYQKDGTYARLKTLTLGYTVPQKFLEKINIKNARIYIAGYNLLTINNTGIFDFDPETRRQDSSQGYPIQRNLSLGVNIGL